MNDVNMNDANMDDVNEFNDIDEIQNDFNVPVNNNSPFNFTEEQKSVIYKLVDYGFSVNDVIQAYIVCDKNEQIALNYLFDK